MSIGMSYADAKAMPVNVAFAMLSDERLDNTHQIVKSKPINRPDTQHAQLKKAALSASKKVRYVPSRRKHPPQSAGES